MKTINRAAVILNTFCAHQNDLGSRLRTNVQHLEYLPCLPAGAEPDLTRVVFRLEAKARNGKPVKAILGTWRGETIGCGVLPR